MRVERKAVARKFPTGYRRRRCCWASFVRIRIAISTDTEVSPARKYKSSSATIFPSRRKHEVGLLSRLLIRSATPRENGRCSALGWAVSSPEMVTLMYSRRVKLRLLLRQPRTLSHSPSPLFLSLFSPTKTLSLHYVSIPTQFRGVWTCVSESRNFDRETRRKFREETKHLQFSKIAST